MTQLEKAMEVMKNVFDKYARADGDGDNLDRAELKKLMKREMPEIFKKVTAKDVDIWLKALDEDGDGEVSFEEFMKLFASVTSAYYSS